MVERSKAGGVRTQRKLREGRLGKSARTGSVNGLTAVDVENVAGDV
jgi:hypothetical protein